MTNRDRRRATERRKELTVALRDDVRRVLNAIYEGKGVVEDPDGDFCVELGELPRWVRIVEKPDAVCVFGFLAFEVPRSTEVEQFLHDTNRSCVMFRTFWEDDGILLRVDLMASPLVPGQLQTALEDFERVAASIGPKAQEWSVS
jgi:hypothetical protein